MTIHPFKPAAVLLALVLPAATSAATREAETTFVAAAKRAFDGKTPADLAKLTCWDGVAAEAKAKQEQTYALLVEERDVTFSVKLAEVDPKFPAKDRKADGAPPRPNLKVLKRLDVTLTDRRDKKILGIIGFPVGEKEGTLLLASEVPAK
jgi:hypothetical protein